MRFEAFGSKIVIFFMYHKEFILLSSYQILCMHNDFFSYSVLACFWLACRCTVFKLAFARPYSVSLCNVTSLPIKCLVLSVSSYHEKTSLV